MEHSRIENARPAPVSPGVANSDPQPERLVGFDSRPLTLVESELQAMLTRRLGAKGDVRLPRGLVVDGYPGPCQPWRFVPLVVGGMVRFSARTP